MEDDILIADTRRHNTNISPKNIPSPGIKLCIHDRYDQLATMTLWMSAYLLR
jgi:hypothetical protein